MIPLSLFEPLAWFVVYVLAVVVGWMFITRKHIGHDRDQINRDFTPLDQR
jgi:hypothetical protein